MGTLRGVAMVNRLRAWARRMGHGLPRSPSELVAEFIDQIGRSAAHRRAIARSKHPEAFVVGWLVAFCLTYRVEGEAPLDAITPPDEDR